jgi:alkylation response protein AidB-like acyl-CoA dehydrogenase
MRYLWSDEQRLLAETMARFVADRCVFDPRAALPPPVESQNWTALADMGVLALPLAAHHGGGGGTALDVALVMEAFGRGLVREPYLSSVILGAGLLQRLAAPRVLDTLLPTIADGSQRMAVAFAETHSRFNLANVETKAVRADDGFLLSGHKCTVYGAPEASHLIVTARMEGDTRAPDAFAIYLVPSDSSGLEVRRYTSVDGFSAGDVSLRQVRVRPEQLLGNGASALAALQATIDEAIVAAAAEAVGIMAALNERCVAHCKSRVAFGKPLAEFQALQHRIVDMHVAYEQASAIVLKAASALSARLPSAPRTVAACKVKVNEEAGFVAKAAVQLHGAMGITEELDVGHYFRRLTALQTLFGSRDHHLRRYIELGESEAGVA